MKQTSTRLERQFGDYQTPLDLAKQCCQLMSRQLGEHTAMVEPTCGRGNFLLAAAEAFPQSQFFGMEQNANYIRASRRLIASHSASISSSINIRKSNFFNFDWSAFRDSCGDTVLFFGNPPWVTHSEIGGRDGDNLPKKNNHQKQRGIDAITGKSNFDLAESMLQTLLGVMREGKDSLAMLVKSATARRLAQDAWRKGYQFNKLQFYAIDAQEHFNASVDAGFLLFQLKRQNKTERATKSVQACQWFKNLDSRRSTIAFGNLDGQLVRDPNKAMATAHLTADEPVMWRSGVKHDLSRVLELRIENDVVLDREGVVLDIEHEHLFPLAKGSAVASGLQKKLDRVLLLPQRRVGDSSESLKQSSPKTYEYLSRNRSVFDARRSSIYRGRDPFAIFGIGPYSFSPWKVAICGLYKRLTFTIYGPVRCRGPVRRKGQAQRKPVMFDDTTYLLPCRSRRHAEWVKELLESTAATDFFNARIFWESKRPINASVLRSLDLDQVAQAEKIDFPVEKR